MKKKYFLAVVSKFLITAIALAVLVGLNFLIFKSCNWYSIAAVGIVLSIWDVVELKKDFKKIKNSNTENSTDSTKTN